MRYSIIIPIYNAGTYLRECLNSVLAQDSPSEWEGILVDDGSTDGSSAICDEYTAKDARFRVIRQANAGVGSARNAGLDAAAGEFVLFLDSDDLWHKDLLSSMDQVPSETDITEFEFESLYKTAVRPAENLSMPPGTDETGDEWLGRLLKAGQWPESMVWKRMWRREFLLSHDLSFNPAYVCAEDLDFTMAAVSCAQKMQYSDKILYTYRVRSSSLSHDFGPSTSCLVMSVCAKWLDRYPAGKLASDYYYFFTAALVSESGRGEDMEELIRIYEENKDILLSVRSWKAKLAAKLLGTFGINNGSKIYWSLLQLKHRMERTDFTGI